MWHSPQYLAWLDELRTRRGIVLYELPSTLADGTPPPTDEIEHDAARIRAAFEDDEK